MWPPNLIGICCGEFIQSLQSLAEQTKSIDLLDPQLVV